MSKEEKDFSKRIHLLQFEVYHIDTLLYIIIKDNLNLEYNSSIYHSSFANKWKKERDGPIAN